MDRARQQTQQLCMEQLHVQQGNVPTQRPTGTVTCDRRQVNPQCSYMRENLRIPRMHLISTQVLFCHPTHSSFRIINQKIGVLNASSSTIMLRLTIGVFKTALVVVFFTAGVLSVVFSQCVGLMVSLLLYGSFNSEISQAWISHTKKSFICVLTAVLSFASRKPITIRLTSPNLDKDRLLTYTDGTISTVLAQHAVFIGNHQIYTDWAYVWWLTYTAKMAGFIYILLKAELSKIPLLGFGMKTYDFIFLTRKWAVDKLTMALHLSRIDANARGKGPASGAVPDANGDWPKGNDPSRSWPYQMLIFPEGTNLSANTRSKTEAYAAKVERTPFKHVLLPKTTGLRYTLLKLRGTVEEVYDLTIGYSGVRPDEYGQDIYGLWSVFLLGNSPEFVDIDIRVINIEDIPLGKLEYDDPEEEEKDKKIFEDWLFDVWQKKDNLMDKYYASGSFAQAHKQITARATTTLNMEFSDILQTFAVPAILMILARLLYVIYSIFYNPPACAVPVSVPNPSLDPSVIFGQ